MASLVINLNSLTLIGWTAQKIVNWVRTADRCVHSSHRRHDATWPCCPQICSDSSRLSPTVGNSVHTADATQLDSCVASASVEYIRLVTMILSNAANLRCFCDNKMNMCALHNYFYAHYISYKVSARLDTQSPVLPSSSCPAVRIRPPIHNTLARCQKDAS